MSKTRLIFAISLEPDFAAVESGEKAPYRINVPSLDFNELAELLEREVLTGDKVSVRCANDYIDVLTLSQAEGMLDKISLYCKHTVAQACSKPGEAKAIDISSQWAAKLHAIDRSEAPPPGILFFTVTGSSLVDVGVWLTVLHMCFGRQGYIEGDGDGDIKPMYPALKSGFEDFFGIPFQAIGSVINLGPAE